MLTPGKRGNLDAEEWAHVDCGYAALNLLAELKLARPVLL